MIYEVRTYTILPKKFEKLSERFEKYTMDVYRRLGIEPVGFFREQIGQQGRFIDILGYPDMGGWEKSRFAFFSDPEWRAISDRYDREYGPFYSDIENSILFPLPCSPIMK